MTLIVTDTTAGLPPALTARLGIPVIPQIVIFGDESFRDDTEITNAEYLRRLRASATLPKTAAPPPALYTPIYEAAVQRGEAVIVVAPSSKISGTVRSAETARQDFPTADIHVVDTQTIAGGLGLLVMAAHDLVRQGKSVDEIVAELNALIPLTHIYFVLDTLEYMLKGGRIGPARAALGTLLQVKPILQVKDGQAMPLTQERTKKRAIARMVELTCEQVRGIPSPHLVVMHSDAADEAESMRADLAAQLGLQDIMVYEIPPAVVTHLGPKTLATCFIDRR